MYKPRMLINTFFTAVYFWLAWAGISGCWLTDWLAGLACWLAVWLAFQQSWKHVDSLKVW